MEGQKILNKEISRIMTASIGKQFDPYLQREVTNTPQSVSSLFVKTALSHDIGLVLLECILFAATADRAAATTFCEKLASSNEYETQMKFIKTEWCIDNTWNYIALNLAGQCVLETGSLQDNSIVTAYRKATGCHSVFSQDFQTELLTKEEQHLAMENRKTFSSDDAKKAGYVIISHLDGLKSSEVTPICELQSYPNKELSTI